jgi:hypothetical protein
MTNRLGSAGWLSGITSFSLRQQGWSIVLPVWGMGAVSAPGKERGELQATPVLGYRAIEIDG